VEIGMDRTIVGQENLVQMPKPPSCGAAISSRK
jgi:hypothetical protein